MVQSLKENSLIRTVLFKLLNGLEANRKIKGMNRRIYFNAGTNFNFFFSRELEIEKEAVNNLTQLIKKDFLIFDIGAHIGYYTIIFSSLCPGGRIIAFEPGSDNLKYLKKNLQMNGIENMIVIEKALSNEIGESLFFEDITTGRSSSLKSDAWHPNATKIKEQKVSTTTMDEISSYYGIPNLIKCDVEGFEVEVLEGASKVLKNKPIIFLEVATQNKEAVMSILSRYNYRIYNGEESLKSQSQPLKEINCQNILCI
ncbi:MAG: hypothetical protein B6D44_09705 [Ignavibacteriales bacterium UTCHB2]|jgi:FkbM family methyltransferase|nr:MAG: hypothetical protein B6D44_09705 [Ignavibacteriales bacterium UTCHB2]